MLRSRPSPRLNLERVNSLEPHSCLGAGKGLIPILQMEKLRLLMQLGLDTDCLRSLRCCLPYSLCPEGLPCWWLQGNGCSHLAGLVKATKPRASRWDKHEAEVEGIHCPAEQVGVKTSPFLSSPLHSERRAGQGFQCCDGGGSTGA